MLQYSAGIGVDSGCFVMAVHDRYCSIILMLCTGRVHPYYVYPPVRFGIQQRAEMSAGAGMRSRVGFAVKFRSLVVRGGVYLVLIPA